MTDKRLLVFTTLARTLSFGETAQLGAALFVRYGRSVTLTEKGRAMLPIAEKILAGYAEIGNIKE